MLSEFLVYLRLGFEHITDPGGMDHLLFVAVLTASDVDRPKHLFWLVTAFTVGHSLTLALATLHLVSVDSGLVEFLIPLTIIATGAVNAFNTGLEVGQLAIVLGLVLAAAALMRRPRMGRPAWTLGVSGIATVAAGLMVLERI